MKNFHNVICFLLIEGLFYGVWAYPMDPTPNVIDNDGDSLTIRNLGDERYHFSQTEDGYLVVLGEDGIYYYADENGNATKFKAKNNSKRKSNEKNFLNKLDKKKIYKSHRENHKKRLIRPEGETKKKSPWVPAIDTSTVDENVPQVLRLPPYEAHTRGNIKFPVLMIESSSQKNLDSISTYNLLNQEKYKENGYTGSVKDYFIDNSNSVFVPSFDLYFVKVDNEFTNYINGEARLISEAISKLKTKYPNFNAREYDSDNDGEVDALVVLYAGGTAKSGSEHLGGFQYELRWNDTKRIDAGNNKKFNNYFIICQKEKMFATFLHEFSHTMGLKDHYCVWADNCYSDFSGEYQAPGAHAWDIMATGMYANNGKTPPSYSAFERNFFGWMEYNDLKPSSKTTVITPLNTTNMAYKIEVNGNKNEWFVLENRQKTGWDASLPNHGLLIWHIDYDEKVWANDAMNDDYKHQRVDVVEAGNIRVKNYNDGFKASNFYDDVFPGYQNVTNYGPFKSWNGTDLKIQLYGIKEENSNVCFATQNGVEVTNCEIISSSSMVEESSSSKIVYSKELIEYTIEIPLSDEYEKTTIDLDRKSIAEKLKLSENEIYKKVSYYGVNADGSLDDTPTAMGKGHWFDFNGNTCVWNVNDKNVKVFSELNLMDMTLSVGHMPDNVSIGDEFLIKQALVYNDVELILSIKIKIKTEMSSSSVIGELNSSSFFVQSSSSKTELVNTVLVNELFKISFNKKDIFIQSVVSGVKILCLFDAQGHLLKRIKFEESTKKINLDEFTYKCVLITQLISDGKIVSVQKFIVK